MKTKRIKLRGEVIGAAECKNTFSKLRGLMFRKKSLPLLLIFGKPTRQSIHSFFCKPFKAIWLKDGKIVDEKTISPFSVSVKPKGEFTELLEIPLENNNNISELPTRK